MPSVINTNVSSLTVQGKLGNSQGALATSLQRLSSGMRVNSAKDDAAGLAIADRMTSYIRGSAVAIRNANDAISLSQTAEGALGKVGDSLQRMRELAVQSANATVGGDDRNKINEEFKQLQEEVTRVVGSTTFNGKKVLATAEALDFQVGAATTATDKISVAATNLSDPTDAVAIAASAKFSLNPAGDAANNTAAVTRFSDPAGANGSITQASISGGAVVAGSIGTNTASAEDKAIVQANLDAAKAGLEAALKVDSTITGGLTVNTTGASPAFDATTAGGDATKQAAVQKAFDTARDNSLKNAGTAKNATDAMDKIDDALNRVSSVRANFGAVQNRFDSVISNLQTSVENQSASRSRIVDTDFAAETANLSRNQILQQAGTAMLAQANSLPNGVLALLRG
jgi:flagellin